MGRPPRDTFDIWLVFFAETVIRPIIDTCRALFALLRSRLK